MQSLTVPQKANVNGFDVMKAVHESEELTSKLREVGANASTFAVLVYLAKCYNKKKGIVFPLQEDIAKWTIQSPKSVQRNVKLLRGAGLFISLRPNRNYGNRYHFTNVFWDLIGVDDRQKILENSDGSKRPLPTGQNDPSMSITNKVINNNLKENYKNPHKTESDFSDSATGKNLPSQTTEKQAKVSQKPQEQIQKNWEESRAEFLEKKAKSSTWWAKNKKAFYAMSKDEWLDSGDAGRNNDMAKVNNILEIARKRIKFEEINPAKSVEQTKKEIKETFSGERKSPMDDYETAKHWISTITPVQMKLIVIKKRVIDVCEKWGLKLPCENAI